MSYIESEEASDDDTTIISELLNSAEAIQISTDPTTSVGTLKMPLQQNDDIPIIPKTGGTSGGLCNTTKQDMVSLQQNGIAGDGLLNCTQYSDMDDLNKNNVRHVHIPYILNGELYQIQTQDGENVTVKCCHCPPDRVYRGSVRSTGNFHMHIKRRHPDLLEKLHDMKVNALLERRDRLMRNRKITHRSNRNRSANYIGNSFKNEKSELTTTTPDPQITFDPTTESSFMHTHKLKIKTVFQRHQMQQREAEEMRNWSKTEYVVMPMCKLPTSEEFEQPINYSLKSQENDVLSSNSLNVSQQSFQHEEKKKTYIKTQTSVDSFTNLNNEPTNLSTCNASEQDILVIENHTNKGNLSSTSISVSCPSVIDSYTSSHQSEIETDRRYNNFTTEHCNLPTIKPESQTLQGDTEAIDLTVHTDSGIFSSSDDNDSENNNNDGSSNDVGAETQKSNTANITMINTEYKSNSGNSVTKWQELLVQVESSLRDIQREMNIRNQIESNRMFLDIAKFKFLNPGFNFNW